jgi:hypothetical protein
MRAKAYGISACAAAAALCSCADLKLERFAPPGVVKFEDLAGDKPTNPAIATRIAERRAASEPLWPDLSSMPTAAPEGLGEVEREEAIETLENTRDALTSEIAAAREAAAAEREIRVDLPGDGVRSKLTLEEARDALQASDQTARALRSPSPSIEPRD